MLVHPVLGPPVLPDMRIPGNRGMRRPGNQEKDSGREISGERLARCRAEIDFNGGFLKRPRVFVLVKNFAGINYDAEIYRKFRDAKREFREYTGFRFNKRYSDPNSPKYNEKFSETKIYDLNLPEYLEMRKDDDVHEERKDR